MQQATETKLKEIFRVALQLGGDQDVANARAGATQTWDSLAHTLLMAALESEFGLEIDVADALALTSYDSVATYLEGRGL